MFQDIFTSVHKHNTFDKYIENTWKTLICVTLYKTAFLTDRILDEYTRFYQQLVGRQCISPFPLSIFARSISSPFYMDFLSSSRTLVVDPRLPHRHEFVIRAQTPTDPRKCHPQRVSTRICGRARQTNVTRHKSIDIQ